MFYIYPRDVFEMLFVRFEWPSVCIDAYVYGYNYEYLNIINIINVIFGYFFYQMGETCMRFYIAYIIFYENDDVDYYKNEYFIQSQFDCKIINLY